MSEPAYDRAKIFDRPLRRTVAWVMWPIDGFTGIARPIELRVRMLAQPAAAPVRERIVGLGGTIAFDGLPAGDYAVTLEPIGRDRDVFFPVVEHTATLGNTPQHVEQIPFWPRASYPYAGWLGVVRGRFLVNGQPRGGAMIEQLPIGPVVPEVLAEISRRRTYSAATGDYAISPYVWEPLPTSMTAPPNNFVQMRVTWGPPAQSKFLDVNFQLEPGTNLDLDLLATE